MKKILATAGLLLILIFSIIFYFQSQLKIVNAWNDEESQIVLTNQVWKIHFSEKIDPKSLDSNPVFILDEEGAKQANEIFLSDDQKTLYISPPENGYDPKSNGYTLHVEKGIKSTIGRGLSSAKKISFVVKETLPVVGSKKKLNDYFLTLMKEQQQTRSLFGDIAESSKSSSDSATANSEAGAKQDVSETNVQVQGVDEADMVKTNGEYIFQASHNKVDIIKAIPAGEMKRSATLSYDHSFSPYQLYLHNEQLVVIGHSYENQNKPMNEIAAADRMIAPLYHSTKAIVYNIKNPGKPEQIREINLEGSYVSSRKIEGIVYLVTNHYPDFWLLEQNNNIDIRPRFSDSSVSSDMNPIDYNTIQYFPDSKESNYTMIAAFDLEKPTLEASLTTYLGSGQQLYMSKENLYLAVPNYLVRPLEDTSRMVTPDTNVYKFSVKGMKVAFHSSAEIKGTILNQFSMDEHEGYFRLVTTKGFAWDENQPSSNQLFILDRNLKQVGQLEELARGERIYSARFLGNRIYMVTFKETDPLFVIDASEPTNPKVLGELKIPGFSNYLHPYDENHLIGFGQDTKLVTDKGTSGPPRVITDGVKITLFDVSDMANPKEKFTEIIGGRGTYSPLNYDHKALLFNKNKNLFAFPITVYQNNEANQYDQIFEFQGAYIYQINPDKGFELKSKITHETGNPQYEVWENSIGRLLYIGDYLYALSPEKISSYDLSSYQKIGESSLK